MPEEINYGRGDEESGGGPYTHNFALERSEDELSLVIAEGSDDTPDRTKNVIHTQILALPNTLNPRQRAFLVAYSVYGNVTKACGIARVARRTHNGWLTNNPVYKECYEEAKKVAGELLEQEAWRRAVDGWEEPVFQKGYMVGKVRKYDQKLLELLLRANLPEKYRENREHGAQYTQVKIVKLSEDEYEAL